MKIANLIKDAEELREIYLNPVFQWLLLVLKPITSSNFIGNNQSIPDGSNACLQSKENVENDTNRQIFETMSKENSMPFDIFIWKEFNELLLLIFYWLPNDLCTGGRNNTFCLPLISLSILHKNSGEKKDLITQGGNEAERDLKRTLIPSWQLH